LKFQDVSRLTVQLAVVRADGPVDGTTRRTIHIPLSPPWMKAATPAYPVLPMAQIPGQSPFSYTPLQPARRLSRHSAGGSPSTRLKTASDF
jgi:hypothetical protein